MRDAAGEDASSAVMPVGLSTGAEQESVRVFISCAQDDGEYVDRVRELSCASTVLTVGGSGGSVADADRSAVGNRASVGLRPGPAKTRRKNAG